MTIIRIANTSNVGFMGWLRCNVDVLPPNARSDNYVLGKRTGLDTHSLDLWCGIGPGERQVLDLTNWGSSDWSATDGFSPKQLWGGIPVAVNGTTLEPVGEPVVNGAAFDGHWHGFVGSLHVDLYVWWYPDVPGWCQGRIFIVGRPDDPATRAMIPPGGLRLRFGDALVLVPGLQHYAPLMGEGDWLAFGQARILPIVLCWPRHGGDLAMCEAVAERKVEIVGLKHLHQAGNPMLPRGFDAAAWGETMRPLVAERQHDWFNSPLDPAYVSGAAGAQGAQSFVCGPAMADPAAAAPFVMGALDGSWPMFYVEPSGAPLDWRSHPTLRMFYGKVNLAISGDNLGKTAWPTSSDSHGYAGPEDEHWFDWVALGGARITGCPAMQLVLRAHATQLLHRYVVAPPGAWLTANRGVGWYAFMVGELYVNLEDRELAEALAQRFREVFLQLIWPMGDTGAWWSWLRDDRIGPGVRAIPWQAAVLALGLDWAGAAIGDDGVRGYAFAIAQEILGRTYMQRNGRWTAWEVICFDGSDPGVDHKGRPLYGSYDWFGTPFVVATVLRHDPNHQVARAIWEQMLADQPGYEQMAWLCPGIP